MKAHDGTYHLIGMRSEQQTLHDVPSQLAARYKLKSYEPRSACQEIV